MINGKLTWDSVNGKQTLTVERTNRAVERLRGLLFRPAPEPGCGLLIDPCNSVHMFGMPYALDVIFLDKEGRILKLVESLKPWRIAACRGAASTLECPVGTIPEYGLETGVVLDWHTSEG